MANHQKNDKERRDRDVPSRKAPDTAQRNEFAALLYPALIEYARHLVASDKHYARPSDIVQNAFSDLEFEHLAELDTGHALALLCQRARQRFLDEVRRIDTAKRGGGQVPVEFDDSLHRRVNPDQPLDIAAIEALDLALKTLRSVRERSHRVVELVHFCGLTQKACAEIIGCSVDTIQSEQRYAYAWLRREIARQLDG